MDARLERGQTPAWLPRLRRGHRRPRVAEADSVLDALCDNLRSIEDFTDVHAAADLFRVI